MSKNEQRQSLKALALLALAPAAAMLCVACGGAGGSAAANPSAGSTSTISVTGSAAYAAAYKAARWSAGAVTVGFADACTMTLTTTGVPPYHANYYLGPVSPANPTSVAVTPVTRIELAVYAYDASNIAGGTATINVCPAKAAATTATGLGPIGYTLAGEALFNPYEANGSTPALTDNVSYTFTSSGKTETASFIDACNSHAAGGPGGATWHYHAVPACLTAQLDGSTGPSHLLGVALDGFPIYGGRDVDGNVVPAAQLDACNGITSPTPEFPGGAYHYVLPIGVTGKQSSLNCYSGTVSRAQLGARRIAAMCGMAALNTRLQAAARARRLRTATRVLAQERFGYGQH